MEPNTETPVWNAAAAFHRIQFRRIKMRTPHIIQLELEGQEYEAREEALQLWRECSKKWRPTSIEAIFERIFLSLVATMMLVGAVYGFYTFLGGWWEVFKLFASLFLLFVFGVYAGARTDYRRSTNFTKKFPRWFAEQYPVEAGLINKAPPPPKIENGVLVK